MTLSLVVLWQQLDGLDLILVIVVQIQWLDLLELFHYTRLFILFLLIIDGLLKQLCMQLMPGMETMLQSEDQIVLLQKSIGEGIQHVEWAITILIGAQELQVAHAMEGIIV